MLQKEVLEDHSAQQKINVCSVCLKFGLLICISYVILTSLPCVSVFQDMGIKNESQLNVMNNVSLEHISVYP